MTGVYIFRYFHYCHSEIDWEENNEWFNRSITRIFELGMKNCMFVKSIDLYD